MQEISRLRNWATMVKELLAQARSRTWARRTSRRLTMTIPSTGFTIYDQLYVYAGSRGRERFILQNVVDAHHAQIATDETKPIVIIMALVGLYLHVEREFTGLQVQQAHMQLGRTRQQWPRIVLPRSRGALTAEHVMQAAEGDERDAAISEWCRSVWTAYADDNRATIIDLLRRHRVI